MEKLIIKYLTDTLSGEELDRLQHWLQNPQNQHRFKAVVRDNQRLDLAYHPIDAEAAYQRVINAIPHKQRRVQKPYRTAFTYAAVAILLIAIAIGSYFILKTDDIIYTRPITKTTPQVTLELEDGTVQVLDENIRTAITDQQGKLVGKQEYDKLLYEQSNQTDAELVYNNLTVPYGKRFKIQLSDGTEVFLNAGTKIKYPKAFTDPDNRELYLDGEAYFTVAENKNWPFIVHTEEMNVQVLGTKFNVSSYRNEDNTSTTLVEGSVQVSSPLLVSESLSPSVILNPGQQALIKENILSVQEVDIEKQTAWTEGKLFFVNDRFETIIKELERHYNIRIENNYPELNDTRYTGTFLTESIVQVLNTFQSNTSFEYRITNHKIIINP